MEPSVSHADVVAGISLRSFAKVNLHLQVVGKRADGYHELRTVFQTVDLADELELTLTTQPGVALTVHGADLPSDERNLAHRAASRLLAEVAPDRGVRIALHKRIPAGGGLGGGSSNAGAVLRGLAGLLPGAVAPERLWQMARELGADVPYFLVGGTVLASGRGDELLPLPEPTPRDLALVLPPVSLATPEVFAAFAGPASNLLSPAVQAVAAGWSPPDRLWGGELTNDLEAAACALAPEVARALAALRAAGVEVARMSGSGSTVYGLLPAAEETSQRALEQVRRALPDSFRLVRCRSLRRAELS
jgi:4-diphosphocytidyl-2-C-methyl-D-erythritol kinase